jgi:hypothetical protein
VSEIFNIYINWYMKKFGITPDITKTVYPKLLDYKAIKYSKLINIIYKALPENTNQCFVKYLDFVFKNWAQCNGAVESHWISWVSSTAMFTRFQGILQKEKLICCREEITCSDHTYAGDSEDVSMVWG